MISFSHKNHLKMKRILLTCLLSVGAIWAFAQSGTVSGTISDPDTNEPLIGANVVIKGTNTGATTDVEGRFSLTSPTGSQTFVITYIGYETIER